MKHLALLLCLLLLVPAGGLCEKILWEDDAGQVVLSDDGNVQFVSPGGEAAAEPIEENIDENTYAPDETPAPVEKSLPNDFSFRKTVKYGDSGELVAQIQARLAELGFYNAKVSGGYYKVTKAAVKAFQTQNGLSADTGDALLCRRCARRRHAAPVSYAGTDKIHPDGGCGQPDYPRLHLRRERAVYRARA